MKVSLPFGTRPYKRFATMTAGVVPHSINQEQFGGAILGGDVVIGGDIGR